MTKHISEADAEDLDAARVVDAVFLNGVEVADLDAVDDILGDLD